MLARIGVLRNQTSAGDASKGIFRGLQQLERGLLACGAVLGHGLDQGSTRDRTQLGPQVTNIRYRIADDLVCQIERRVSFKRRPARQQGEDAGAKGIDV